MLRIREGEFLKQNLNADENGRFSTIVQFPEDLPYGSFTIEAVREGKGAPSPLLRSLKLIRTMSFWSTRCAERMARKTTKIADEAAFWSGFPPLSPTRHRELGRPVGHRSTSR